MHSPVDSISRGSQSWPKPLRVLLTLPSLCYVGIKKNKKQIAIKSLRNVFSSPSQKVNRVAEESVVPTCFSQPWTAVCNHQRASDSSPWKASERCRWGRGWSCKYTHRHTYKSDLYKSKQHYCNGYFCHPATNLKWYKRLTIQSKNGTKKKKLSIVVFASFLF